MNPERWSVRARAGVIAVCGLLGLTALAGCDNGPSAVETRADRGAWEERIERRSAEADRAYASREDGGERGDTERGARPERRASADETPTFQGRPLWSSNRRYDAETNARRHYERNGEALGARSYQDFLKRVHAFTGSPPKDALTLTRANGDLLIYAPKENLFAVVTAEGAPRTMFKPDDGMAYWERQKVREAAANRRAAGRAGGDEA
jgi:pyocin large subunit-like protein